MNTIFTSPGLVLIGVTWAWAVALKLVRYEKYDPYDVASILHLHIRQHNVKRTWSLLERWLSETCSAMGYTSYPPDQMEALRERMCHAVAHAHRPEILRAQCQPPREPPVTQIEEETSTVDMH